MAERDLEIGRGIAQGFEKAMTNIYNIRVAREKLDREKKGFELDYKVKSAQLDKLKLDPMLNPEVARGKTELLQSEQKLEKAGFDLKFEQIDQANEVAMKELNNAEARADLATDIYAQIKSKEIPSERISLKDGKIGVSALTKKKKTTSVSGIAKLEKNIEEMTRELEATKGVWPAKSPLLEGEERVRAEAMLERFKGDLREARGEAEPVEETTYNPEQEQLIKENMEAHNRSREEIIKALKDKGHL